MQLETVDSTAIHAIGYNAETRTLEIIFTGGGIYHFAGVPAPLYRRMKSAASLGTFFQENVRGRFRFSRIDPPRRRASRQLAMPGV